MGDMADLINDTWDWWGIGDDAWGDDACDLNTGYKPRPKTCKFCKTKNLHWVQVKNVWRLADKTGLPHACNRGLTNAIFASQKGNK